MLECEMNMRNTYYVGVQVLLSWKKSFPVTKPNPTKLLSFQLVNAMVGLQLATFPNGDKLTFFIDHWLVAATFEKGERTRRIYKIGSMRC